MMTQSSEDSPSYQTNDDNDDVISSLQVRCVVLKTLSGLEDGVDWLLGASTQLQQTKFCKHFKLPSKKYYYKDRRGQSYKLHLPVDMAKAQAEVIKKYHQCVHGVPADSAELCVH